MAAAKSLRWFSTGPRGSDWTVTSFIRRGNVYFSLLKELISPQSATSTCTMEQAPGSDNQAEGDLSHRLYRKGQKLVHYFNICAAAVIILVLLTILGLDSASELSLTELVRLCLAASAASTIIVGGSKLYLRAYLSTTWMRVRDRIVQALPVYFFSWLAIYAAAYSVAMLILGEPI